MGHLEVHRRQRWGEPRISDRERVAILEAAGQRRLIGQREDALAAVGGGFQMAAAERPIDWLKVTVRVEG